MDIRKELKLKGQEITMVVGGSISAYRTPDIIRDLKSNGASVKVILSNAASKIIGKQTLEWASEMIVLEELTGLMEHINFFSSNDLHKTLLICPATYNMVGKMANGIADTPAETIFANALGMKINTVIVPAMHLEMYLNPIFQRNINALKAEGVKFVEPRIEDGKAKIMWTEEIIDTILRKKSTKEKILIVSGKSELRIDPVRSITNKSTGYTGITLTRQAFVSGYEEITYIGNSDYRIPYYCKVIPCEEIDQFYKLSTDKIKENEYDFIFIPAALSDFSLEPSPTKIKSEKLIDIHLKAREKLIDNIRQLIKEKMYITKLVRFKLGDDNYVGEKNNDIIVFNNVSQLPFGTKGNHYKIFKGEQILKEGDYSKEELSRIIIEEVLPNNQ
jgi:phosphopantothenoylcysteine decarboxylase/phosphopantothenate--cysteine ligase